MSASNGSNREFTPDFTTELFGDNFDHPFMIGAGPGKDIPDALELARTPSIAIIIGSTHGNPPAYLNLNNPEISLERYEEDLPKIREIAHNAEGGKKLFIVSVAGFYTEQVVRAAKIAEASGADGVEVNGGFRIYEGRDVVYEHPADPDTVATDVLEVKKELPPGFLVGSKLARYEDSSMLVDVAQALGGLGVSYIVGVGLDQIGILRKTYPLSESNTTTPEIFAGESGSDPNDCLRYLQEGYDASAVQFVKSYFGNHGVIGDYLSKLYDQKYQEHLTRQKTELIAGLSDLV